jgi:hypothetical protein
MVKSKTLILFAASLVMFGCVSPSGTKTYVLPSWGNGVPRLQIDLPSSFSMKPQEGPDFDVYYFSDSSTKSSMGLYAGHHPSMRSRESGVVDVQRQTGRVGDVSVEWQRWTADGRHCSETLVHDLFGKSAPKQYSGLILHVFMSAPTAEDVARMEAAASTLRLESAR